MPLSKSSDPAPHTGDQVPEELAAAEALGLIATPEMANAVKANLELLRAHYEIVSAVKKTLDGADK